MKEFLDKLLSLQTAIIGLLALAGYLIIFLFNYGYLTYFHVPYGLVELPRNDIYAAVALAVITPFFWIEMNLISTGINKLLFLLFKIRVSSAERANKYKVRIETFLSIIVFVAVTGSFMAGEYIAQTQKDFYYFESKYGNMLVIRIYPDRILAKKLNQDSSIVSNDLYVFPISSDSDFPLDLHQMSIDDPHD